MSTDSSVRWADERAHLEALRPALELRARIGWAIHEFFDTHDFIEISTPVRLAAPALEEHIDAEPSGNFYLRTSPELHMKRLAAAGYERIYQIGPCFRRGERGRLHRPEYTLLEWYRTHAEYRDILLDTRALLQYIAEACIGETTLDYQGRSIELRDEWEWLTVTDAFTRYARWNPLHAWDADRFDLDLVEKIEPALSRDHPVVLADYPAPAAALARLNPNKPEIAERWELYIVGLELANAYSELTDPVEQRARFAECAAARAAAGKPVYPLDETFLEALDDLPPCAGIALGVDRLVMLFADAWSLDEITPFDH